MNRIYQGKVSRVEVLKMDENGKVLKDKDGKPEWQLLEKWEDALWQHHELFQDAVNYYIVALASLGISPESKLTRLRGLLAKVWDTADKQGQRRIGMRESLRRAWQMEVAPTLDGAVNRIRSPLVSDSIDPCTSEKAAEYLLFKLGGDSAIQQGGRDFFPMFCDVDANPTYKLSVTRRGRADDEKRLQRELHRELSEEEVFSLSRSITLGSVVNLQAGVDPDVGAVVVDRLRLAAAGFSKEISPFQLEEWLGSLPSTFCLPKRRGGNINVKRVDACSLFLAFPNATTKAIFQGTFKPPKETLASDTDELPRTDDVQDESRFLVDGDDPIKLSRGSRGFVFQGFTSLRLWRSEQQKLVWKEFDIAAFKEALKVYNQFQQNLEKREENLNVLATKLLIMDGEQAIAAYAADTEADRRLRARLEKLWKDSSGKPKMPKNESGEETSLSCFTADPRIDRLRKIINDDLAEEYRLTEGRRTPYGLRRRTMKGWGDVKRCWREVKAGEPYSDDKRQKLKEKLDDLRSGEKREQIGSHRLFEALLVDEAAWSIWREPGDDLQRRILKNGWSEDPLESFREYCEVREAMEEVSARPLNFTPADSRYSRRLFMFTDACSFGNENGEFKHDVKSMAVTVPVATIDASGCFAKQVCRLSYSAPRLLRDGIRAKDGHYVQDWVQPMMRAIFQSDDKKTNPQSLVDAAVQLMPDYDDKGRRRLLLNFPLALDGKFIQQQLGKHAAWEKQFVSWKRGAQLPYLRSEAEFDGKEPHRWFEKVSTFKVLAADLGTRHVAAVALVECRKEQDALSRHIGHAGGSDWYGRYRSGVVLRLPGENAQVLRYSSRLDIDNDGSKAFREELFGERGRFADDAECQETLNTLTALNQVELLNGIMDVAALKKEISFPEQNDKLLVALRRTQNWVAACVSWHWKLSNPEADSQRTAALEQLRDQDRIQEWSALANGSAENLSRLPDVIAEHINCQRQLAQSHLLQLTRRVLPLRNRDWEWVAHPDKTDCHLLRQSLDGTGHKDTKLRGQRGLSMARIEQISELRRRWQSLNQSLRRKLGEKPPTASEMRNDPIPDPCPDLLAKLEHIREQRVNQTAHLILAQALGLRLREPQLSAKDRTATDTHGEYEKFREPVDFIVIEDLSRYLSDQGRAKSENTRLMKWCHRAVGQKLKMLTEIFGIPVLETPAAYSSRFCSLSGAAGFRAAEVGWHDRDEYRWRVLLKEAEQARSEGKEPTENARYATELFLKLKVISTTDKPYRTLLAPQPGGPMFATCKGISHPAPQLRRGRPSEPYILPMQADINAAVNLAFRAVAHPACADIHHRVRTEKGNVRETRRFGKEKVPVLMRDGDSLPKERNSNLFYDKAGIAYFGRARLSCDKEGEFIYAIGPGLMKAINDREAQWRRCNEINQRRLMNWKVGADNFDKDEIPM